MLAPNGNTALIYTQPAAAGNLLITTSQQRCTASDWDLSRQCCSDDLLPCNNKTSSVNRCSLIYTRPHWYGNVLITTPHQTPAVILPTIHSDCNASNQNQQRSKMLFDFHSAPLLVPCLKTLQSRLYVHETVKPLNCTTLTASFQVTLLCINSTP